MKKFSKIIILIFVVTSSCKSHKEIPFHFTEPYNHLDTYYDQLILKQYAYYQITGKDTITYVHFNLNPDKKFLLLINWRHGTYSLKEYTDHAPDTTYSGFSYEFEGTWKQVQDRVECEFKGSSLLDDLFLKSNFKTKNLIRVDTRVIFPMSTDTIFIKGDPCKSIKAAIR